MQIKEIAAHALGLWLSLGLSLPALVVPQVRPALSYQLPFLGVSSVNCEGSAFATDLKRLSDTITERTNIESGILQAHFGSCTIEAARNLLVRSGFDVEEVDPRTINSEVKRATNRLVLAEKTLRTFGGRGSLNCRLTLRQEQSGQFTVDGFFYLDGP